MVVAMNAMDGGWLMAVVDASGSTKFGRSEEAREI